MVVPASSGCPSDDLVAGYLDGTISAETISEVDAHVDRCAECRRQISELATVHSFSDDEQPTLPGVVGHLGRYELVRELARGGMGVVYRAFDPQLERAIALKVLGSEDRAGREREVLIREAQAMARLVHPNVVRVYDVGTHDDAVWIAMELVDGGTLRGRMRDPNADLLDACVRAGHGLAAAHDAHIVHRDFKPENVLCGVDGRVVVSDFGLAACDGERAGGIAGTIGYIAPELWLGGPATAASDQFSFCVTAYEALCGVRPFAGTAIDEVREAMTRPPARPVRDVAPRILAALLRGLSPEPGARYASMRDLLGDLAPVRRRGRTRVVMMGALAIAATTLAIAGHRLSDDHTSRSRASASRATAQTLLERGRAELQTHALSAAERTLTDAITAAEQAGAPDLTAEIWVELLGLIGAHQQRFEAATATLRAAEAAFARYTPSPALRARLSFRLGATYLSFGRLDEAALHLDAALAQTSPEDRLDRGLVLASRCDLFRKRGNTTEAREACRESVSLLEAALGPGHVRIATVVNTWGAVEIAAGQLDVAAALFERAIRACEAANDLSNRTLALALVNRAVVWRKGGDVTNARPLFERAAALFATYNPDHPQRIYPIEGLASIALVTGDHQRAVRLYESARDVIARTYARDSDNHLVALYNLALAYRRTSEVARAERTLDELIEIARAPETAAWERAAQGLDLKAELVERTGAYARSAELRDEALTLIARVDRPATRAWLEMRLGAALIRTGQLARAEGVLERAAAHFATDTSDPYVAGCTHYHLAELRRRRDGERAARAPARIALDLLSRAEEGVGLETMRARLRAWLGSSA